VCHPSASGAHPNFFPNAAPAHFVAQKTSRIEIFETKASPILIFEIPIVKLSIRNNTFLPLNQYVNENREDDMTTGRRQFLHATILGGAALVVGHKALAELCSISPSQTTGPFVPDDFPFRDPSGGHPYIIAKERDADLTRVEGKTDPAQGQMLYLRGQIVDQDCRPVPFAQVYLWQADEHGHYNNSHDPNINTDSNPARLLDANFQYRGIVVTDGDGRFQFKTIKPKYYPLDPAQPDFKRTAHLHIGVMKNGYRELFTQAYFEGDLLEDIAEIRRLNKIDILLGEWKGNGDSRVPTGRINPIFLPLIANYREERGYDALVGDVRLTIQRTV
jgi:protocatechuate 3,4-dioxygenase, beta subunit